MKQIYRFHSKVAAAMVLDIARTLTNAELELCFDKCTDTRQDPAGDWVVCTLNDYHFYDRNRIYDCINQALQLALADQLQKYDPYNFLLSVWHLKQENRSKLRHYNIDEGGANG